MGRFCSDVFNHRWDRSQTNTHIIHWDMTSQYWSAISGWNYTPTGQQAPLKLVMEHVTPLCSSMVLYDLYDLHDLHDYQCWHTKYGCQLQPSLYTALLQRCSSSIPSQFNNVGPRWSTPLSGYQCSTPWWKGHSLIPNVWREPEGLLTLKLNPPTALQDMDLNPLRSKVIHATEGWCCEISETLSMAHPDRDDTRKSPARTSQDQPEPVKSVKCHGWLI